MDPYPHETGHFGSQQAPPPQQQQQQPQPSRQQPPWPPHLLPPGHVHSQQGGQSSFPSPVTPPSAVSEQQHYPAYYNAQQQQHADSLQLDRTPSHLSLNMSSLSVASPTNLSPITPSPLNTHSNSTTSSTMSPITPISPSQNPFTAHHHQHHLQSQPYPYPPIDHSGALRYEDPQPHSHYDLGGRRLLGGNATGNVRPPPTDKSVPRKRSFTGAPASVPEEPEIYDDSHAPSHINTGFDLGPGGYDDLDMSGYTGSGGAGGSPVDDSTSGGENDDILKPLDGGMGMSGPGIPPGSMNVLGKPIGTNNFVTKLYQMINDPKSAHFIAWTDLGTSFVVSNVGEFSRSILGSHFKHNNFSSFVRQLNMYGFHKINRTPRAQRTSTDAQTWEFSHHKFLRGRPDLLDEIKRKALEPDPAIKHRVELPGEVAAQLGQMRDENRRMWETLAAERRKVERLTGLVKGLWDVVGKNIPGSVSLPFPNDVLDNTESPNIYVTSPPSNSRYPPQLHMSISSQSLQSLQSLNSPTSSPTTGEPPLHVYEQQQQQSQHQHQHTLSRQHSFQHPYRGDHSAATTPLPPSPCSASMDLELFDGGEEEGRGSSKRQRTSNDPGQNPHGDPNATSNNGSSSGPGNSNGKRLSRARSDSAPLGYSPLNMSLVPSWQQQQQAPATRPRSGTGFNDQRTPGSTPIVPSMGNIQRAPPAPMLATIVNASGTR